MATNEEIINLHYSRFRTGIKRTFGKADMIQLMQKAREDEAIQIAKKNRARKVLVTIEREKQKANRIAELEAFIDEMEEEMLCCGKHDPFCCEVCKRFYKKRIALKKEGRD